jgi:fibronectin-binding autotransporter adhesin
MKISKIAILLAFVFCSAAGSTQAATDLYWSANGSTLGGSGTWDTSTGQWSSDGSAPFSTVWDNGNNDTAIFGGTAGTVTNSGVTVGGLTFSTAGYTITGSALTFGTAGIITNAVDATISSPIAGSVAITKNGIGTLILSGTSTYTGDTAINAGKLQIGVRATPSGSKLGNGNYAGNIFIGVGASLVFETDQNQTLSGDISGAGSLGTYRSGGALTLSGNNTYTGQTTIGAGPNAQGGGTLIVTSLNSVNNPSAYSSLGRPTTVGNGTIVMGSGNSSPNPTLIYNGPGETTDRVINIIFNSSANRTLVANGSGLLKFTSAFTANGLNTGVINLQGSGSGELVQGLPFLMGNLNKSGTGTWTLGGRIGAAGTITISAGTLIGVVGGSCSNSVVTVNNTAGCTLGIFVNDSAKQWTCNALTLAGANAKLAFGFTASPSTTLAPLNVTSNLTFTGTPGVTIDPANLTSGTYPLLTYGGTLAGTAPSSATIGRGLTGATAWNGNTLELTVSGTSTLPLTWATSGSGTWNINTTANWKDNTTTAVNYLDGVITGDPVVFDDTHISGDTTVTLNTTVKPDSVSAANSTYNYTITGSGKITGTTGLTKSGSGNVTLATTNTYTGATVINGGTLTGQTGGSCNSSDVTVNSNSALGVRVTDSTKQFSCKSVTVSTATGTALKFAFTVAPSTTLAPLKVNGDLTFTGTPVVDVNSANLVMGTTIPLLVVGGTAPTAVPELTGVGGDLFWNNKTLYLTPQAAGTVILLK